MPRCSRLRKTQARGAAWCSSMASAGCAMPRSISSCGETPGSGFDSLHCKAKRPDRQCRVRTLIDSTRWCCFPPRGSLGGRRLSCTSCGNCRGFGRGWERCCGWCRFRCAMRGIDSCQPVGCVGLGRRRVADCPPRQSVNGFGRKCRGGNREPVAYSWCHSSRALHCPLTRPAQPSRGFPCTAPRTVLIFAGPN